MRMGCTSDNFIRANTKLEKTHKSFQYTTFTYLYIERKERLKRKMKTNSKKKY